MGEEKSTFFPDTWDENKIIREIEFAFSNRIQKLGSREWKGISSEGIIITGFADNSGNITTAFPTFVL